MPLSLNDALRIAMKDPQFAQELVQKPDEFKAQFNITDAQIKRLKELSKAAESVSLGLKPPKGPKGPGELVGKGPYGDS